MKLELISKSNTNEVLTKKGSLNESNERTDCGKL